MGKCDDGQGQSVDTILNVIKITSGGCVLVGLGAMVCGVLTLVYADPVWEFPYTAGHGLWAGLFCLLQGMSGLWLVRKYDKDNIQCMLITVYRVFAQINVSTCGIHLGYAISGLVQCTNRSESDGREKCNVMEHDNLLAVQAVSIGFGAFMLIFAFFGLFYLLCGGRAQALANNPNYGRCKC